MGYFLVHGGSADHTGEDRVRGICRLLPEQPEIFSPAPEEDWRYGLAELGALTRIRPGSMSRRVKPGDWVVTARPGNPSELRRGVRRILWGWEPAEALSSKQAAQLSRFHRVVVTDQRSQTLLCRVGLEKTVRFGPDPSFLVGPCPRPAAELQRRETVGLCFSASVTRFEGGAGLLYRNYCHLIRWILRNTTWQIALIPYCVRRDCSDGHLHHALMTQFSGEDRLICREDGSCRELRYDLSLCRCCVGTAGVPAAWSCGVPGLCIGDSGRVRGLSGALYGGNREGVIRADSLRSEEDLTRRFQQFLRREDVMRRWLEVSVPRYRQWAREWSWRN